MQSLERKPSTKGRATEQYEAEVPPQNSHSQQIQGGDLKGENPQVIVNQGNLGQGLDHAIQPLGPIIDQIKQVISTTNRVQQPIPVNGSQIQMNPVPGPQTQQQFVQFYPNQTQYVINLHNHINNSGYNTNDYQQRSNESIQGDNRGQGGIGRTTRKRRDISNHSYNTGLANQGNEVNSNSAAGFAGGLIAGIIGPQAVSSNRGSNIASGWRDPSHQDNRYQKGMRGGKNRKGSLNCNYSGVNVPISAMKQSEMTSVSRRKAALNNKNYKSLQPRGNITQTDGQMRTIQQMDQLYPNDRQLVSNSNPTINDYRQDGSNNQRIQPPMFLSGHDGDLANFNKSAEPTIPHGFTGSPGISSQSPRKGREHSQSKQPQESNISGNRMYQPNAKVSLNDMFRPKNTTTGMVSLGMLANNHTHLGTITGGPKLFIKQNSNNSKSGNRGQISQQDRGQIGQVYKQSNSVQRQQYQAQKVGPPQYETITQGYHQQGKLQSIDMNQQTSHLEMYKSIPLKNLKNSRGANVINRQNNTQHQKVASGNYQNTLSVLSNNGEFNPVRTNMNLSSQISINKKLTTSNNTSKSPGRNRNHTNISNVAINSGTRNGDHSLNSQKRGGIQNHFKVNKKLSVQNNVSHSLVSNQIRLVSNVASVSQSQVGTIVNPNRGGQFSGKINISNGYPRQNIQQLHSLKTRYGRKIKNSTSRTHAHNDSAYNSNRHIAINESLSTGTQQWAGQNALVSQRSGRNSKEDFDLSKSIGQQQPFHMSDPQLIGSRTGPSNRGQQFNTISGNGPTHQTQSSQKDRNSDVNYKSPLKNKLQSQGSRGVQLSELYQAHNSQNPHQQEFKILNESQPQRFRKNQNSGASRNLERHTVNLSGVSRVNKNLSPISILDNSLNQQIAGQPFTHEYGDTDLQLQRQQSKESKNNEIQKNMEQHKVDLGYTIKEEIGKGAKGINLTEHIRKANKIQIKKRFEQENGFRPESILDQAKKLYDGEAIEKALKKYLEYIKMEPLDTQVHYRIGMIYTKIAEKNRTSEHRIPSTIMHDKMKLMANAQEEAILHFEQVIKHNEHYKTIDKDDKELSPITNSKQLSAKALFEIIKIHVESRDFYEANYQLDRAFHFGYHTKGSQTTQDDGVTHQLLMYRQLVHAVILLMKRKFDNAMTILKAVDQGYQLQGKSWDAARFQYMVCTYRSYGYITMKKYELAILDLERAKMVKQIYTESPTESLLDEISEFNLMLTIMLQIPPSRFGGDPFVNLMHGNEKLKQIIAISQQFPENKDMIRYHAIYLVQQQILFEVNSQKRASKNRFKLQMTKDLRNLEKKAFQTFDATEKGPQSKGIQKSRSHIMHLNSSPERETLDKEQPVQEPVDRFYEKVSTSNIDHPVKNAVMRKALAVVNQGLASAPRDRNLLLTRSTLLFYLHNFYEALCDVDAAIDLERASSGEEEPNAEVLLHKGRCHACLSMFKEAISDFTKVIELDDELFDAYFFRGKCAYLIGDTSQAFLDFQKLILLQPKNPMVHAYAGDLLMTTGSYEDAAKAFTNADSVQSCAFAIYQRARCFLAVGDIKNSLSDLQKACGMYDGDEDLDESASQSASSNRVNHIAFRDKECLENIIDTIQLLRSVSYSNKVKERRLRSGSSSGPVMDDLSSENYEPSEEISYDSNNSSNAVETKSKREAAIVNEKILYHDWIEDTENEERVETLTKKLTQLIQINTIELREIPAATSVSGWGSMEESKLKAATSEFRHVTQESRMHQQIIPNVNRIKIEKVRALRRSQAKQELIYENKLKKKKSTNNILVFNLDEDETDQQMREEGSKICPWSYYMENLFSKDDLYLYRGVLNFYKGDYAAAIKDYQQSYRVKKLYKILDNEVQESPRAGSPGAEDSDLCIGSADRENMLDESTASDKTDLSDVGLCSLNKNEMLFNIILSQVKLGKYPEALKLADKLLGSCPPKYGPDIIRLSEILTQWILFRTKNHVPEDASRAPTLVQPFKVQHRLCKFYPCMIFECEGADKLGGAQLATFLARPSFSFPFVKPPNMIPNVDETLLHGEFGLSKDEQNLPQPLPLWIKTLGIMPKNQGKSTQDSVEGASIGVPQVQQHFQFTDTIVQQSESYLSQSQSQSCLSSQTSQNAEARQSRMMDDQKYDDIEDDIQISYYPNGKPDKDRSMDEKILPVESSSKLLQKHERKVSGKVGASSASKINFSYSQKRMGLNVDNSQNSVQI